MKGQEPLVNVTILAYNHGRYIRQTIQSVLDQTYRNLEVIVVNDGSTDNTREILERIADPRVKIFHQANQGPSAAANRALSECRGTYLAIMAGDDLLPPHRIESQLREYLKGGSRILFSQVDFIDEDNNPTNTNYYVNNLTPALGRANVLRRLFDGSSPAFILTLFTETAILKAEPQYCVPALYQLQDYDLMIRLAKKYDFAYQDEKLYRFRLRQGHVNLSGPDPAKLIRTRNEFYLIMRNFFDGIPMELFKEIFPDRVRKPDFQTPLEYLCEQAFVMLTAPTASLRLLGAERIYDLLRDEQTRTVLQEQYNFTHITFANTIKSMDTEKMFGHTHAYLDTGKGFREEEQIYTAANSSSTPFSLRFDLSNIRGLREVRWDPVENRLCQVWLDSAAWEDSQGERVPIDVKKLASNGVRRPDGSILFGTTDPMIFLPTQGEVAGLALDGRWELRSETSERFQISTLSREDGTSVAQHVYQDNNDFELTFDTSSWGQARKLRWSPVQGCFCKVQLHRVTCRSLTGAQHTLDLRKIETNGELLGDGVYLFDTFNPVFSLLVPEAVASITIQGRWWWPVSETEVQCLKRLVSISSPTRLVRWVVKGGVRKIRKLGPWKRAA